MKWSDHIKEGLRSLYFSKLRSTLALLGILVGTASVVAMVLGGELATQEALRQFKTLGTDLLALSINTAQEESATAEQSNVSLEQALALPSVDTQILRVAPYTQLYYPTHYNGKPLNSTLLGVTDSFAQIVQVKLLQGRFISPFDRYNFYCVIGNRVYEEIKKATYASPLGQQLYIGKNVFTIVGVAAPWQENSFVYADINNSIMLPLLASTMISKYATINNIIMQLTPQANIADIEEHVTYYLQQSLGKKEFFYRSAKELIVKMKAQSQILTVFLGLIGSISLIVGGIGVMNIMLVSVVERRREIGIRLAIGATRRDIGALFLFEAIILALVGGIAGVTLGILITYIVASVWHWPFQLFLLPPLTGFLVSSITGVFFGFYPALRASRWDPIQALRSE
ncbi:MAG: hypothetical protein A3E83_05390 [Gammaproteobacteria bacterium RIFCSPHIGHO2_12_FULL_41_20]|nr:MAG: hypothetical protein A3E83_05390 [Gammaproteobacteria bacterium RIFCSPHIGHO2_12_FULL_41_20]